MEENEVKNDVQITDDVFSVIAGMAIQDIEGVAKTATGFTGGISEAFGKKNYGKGVKTEINGKDVKVEVSIIVKYGAKIQEVAKQIQEKIKTDVEAMTGFNVIGVNVKVQGIENKVQNEEESKDEVENIEESES